MTTLEQDNDSSSKEVVIATAQPSISPEYKSSWNDVNIQVPDIFLTQDNATLQVHD